MSALRDVLRVLSYLFFPSSYSFYRLAKCIYALIQPETFIASQSDYSRAVLAAEGFVHSGNSFLRSNAAPASMGKVIGHIHRPWALKGAINNGVPLGLLIRTPSQVALSMHYRSLISGQNKVSYWSALACWILYYRFAWRYRKRMIIIPFDRLINDYEAVCRQLEQFSEAHFSRPPSFGGMNRLEGPRPNFRPSFIARLLERKADRLYRSYLDLA